MTRTVSAVAALLLLVACPPPELDRAAFVLNEDMGCAEYNCDLGIKVMVFEVAYDPPLATPADEAAP